MDHQCAVCGAPQETTRPLAASLRQTIIYSTIICCPQHDGEFIMVKCGASYQIEWSPNPNQGS